MTDLTHPFDSEPEPEPEPMAEAHAGAAAAQPASPRLPLAPPLSRAHGAWAGLVAGALAVTTGMLLAAITDVVSPIDAVGSEVIDRSPRAVKEWAIRTFGQDDKLVLRIGIVVVLAIAALAFGALAVRRPLVGVLGIDAFGVVGALAAANRPGEGFAAAVPSLLGAVVGGGVLYLLVRRRPIQVPGESQAPLGWDRRRFLAASGGAAVAAGAAGTIARVITSRRESKFVAQAAQPVDEFGETGVSLEIPAGAEVDPNTPFVTPNADFYRIDTALSLPRADASTWSFTIDGMVDRPLTLTYADLLAREQQERLITICCVSNEVGGRYIGNAVWRGVMLRDLLEEAGVQAGAEQVFSTSLDGWTCGFPVAAAFDGRDAMVAVAMNGEPLPLPHGYPARLIVPGLYGYVSATKWLARIELTSWAREGYWVPRGWAREAPIKTQSRIGYPRHGVSLTAGPTKIAGVAWAQRRGIEQVEVQVGDGPWQVATLATDVSDDSWRQWVVDWDAPAGDHVIRVRATDKNGDTQPEERTAVAPDGATGWHSIAVTVR